MTSTTQQLSFSPEDALSVAKIQPSALVERFSHMHSTEIAELLLSCKNDEQRQALVEHVPDHILGDTLLELPEGMQEDLLADFKAHEIGDVVEHLNSDDATDLLQNIEAKVAHAVIQSLEPDDRRDIEPLMAYDEETAGGLMQVELFKVRHDWTVKRVMKVLRRWSKDIENLNYVYVVDDEDHFVSVLSLHRLLFIEPQEIISKVADASFPRVMVNQDQEKVAKIFDKYDILAIPVIDEQGVLIGRITADDVIDVIHEEATEDMYRLVGLSDEDDLSEPIGITAWRRGVWLMVNLFTAILASVVIFQFQDAISKIVALAVLMPIVASMGGIAGTQTLTVIVRGIALGRVTYSNAKRMLWKETMVGLLTGMSFACLIGLIVSFWFPDYGISLGLVIAAAMFTNLCAAGLAGSLIPLTLQRLNIDPALASGTILTTVTDVVGFVTFLGLSTIFLL
ncbi:MAG: magnesium transporter [Mariprofundaceae bacterium]|nr:magnesium transporter [Mariprofundaceae bacterium]